MRILKLYILLLIFILSITTVSASESLTTKSGDLIYNIDTVIDSKFEANFTTLKCSSEGKSCVTYSNSISIETDSKGNKKSTISDDSKGGSNWYIQQLTSNQPLIQRNDNLWSYQTELLKSCNPFGCIQYYQNYDIDFYGTSSFDLDNDNTTEGNTTFEYLAFYKDVNETIFDYAILVINFYSGPDSDPTFQHSTSAVATSGLAVHNGTQFSRGDNDLALNQSTDGDTLFVEPIDIKTNLNVTNISINMYQDLACSSTTLGIWRFEEGSGTTANNECINNYDGTIVGAIYNCTDAKLGTCSMQFDGAGDSINLSNSANVFNFNNSIFTIGGWFNTNATSGRKAIVSKYTVPTQWLVEIEGDESLRAYFTDGGGNLVFQQRINNVVDGEWHQFFAVMDNFSS